MLDVSHHWPGITPLNALDLELRWWLVYVAGARELREEAQRQRRELDQMGRR